MSQKIKLAFYIVLSLSKTIVFNFLYFPLRFALTLPIFIGYDVKIVESHRGIIKFAPVQIKPFMIRFGWGGSKALAKENQSRIMLSDGSVVFHGKACFAEGTILTSGGDLEIGDHFSTNKNCFSHVIISCI